MCPSTNNPK